MTIFGAELDREIRRRGLSREQAAHQIGVTSRTVYNWITAGRVPHPMHRKAADTWMRNGGN